MKGLPTGMFLPGNSVLHRLDARMKFLCFFLLLAAVCCTNTLLGYGVMLAVTAAVLVLSRLPVKTALGSVQRLIPFFVVIFLMNACFFSADDAWVSIWIFHPSPAGVMQAVNVTVRVLLVLLLGNVLTCTTAPMEMTGALKALLQPLGVFRLPVGQISMILSVAIQFIPTLFEETDMIRKAQTARGARFDSRKLLDKAAAVMPLVVPIFLSAFKRADELSMAMEARGYRTNAKRRGKKRAPMPLTQYPTLFACAGLCALAIWIL